MSDYVADTNPELPDRDFEHNMSLNTGFHESFEAAFEQFHPALCKAISNFVCEATAGRITPKNYFTNIIDSEDIFVTFNYTKLLETVYKVDERNIKHIHGIAYPRIYHKDDDIDSYGDPAIIFGHGNLSKTQNVYHNYDYNPFNPQQCLKTLNQELEKDYQTEELKAFVSKFKNDIDTVEIIGHNLGEVDAPYFTEMNKMLSKNVKINYWLFDEKEEYEKSCFLKSIFRGHTIQIKFYPIE